MQTHNNNNTYRNAYFVKAKICFKLHDTSESINYNSCRMRNHNNSLYIILYSLHSQFTNGALNFLSYGNS